jgi:hypothetical protein
MEAFEELCESAVELIGTAESEKVGAFTLELLDRGLRGKSPSPAMQDNGLLHFVPAWESYFIHEACMPLHHSPGCVHFHPGYSLAVHMTEPFFVRCELVQYGFPGPDSGSAAVRYLEENLVKGIERSHPNDTLILSRILNYVPDPLGVVKRAVSTRAPGAAVIFTAMMNADTSFTFNDQLRLGILGFSKLAELRASATLRAFGAASKTLTSSWPQHFVVGASFQLK